MKMRIFTVFVVGCCCMGLAFSAEIKQRAKESKDNNSLNAIKSFNPTEVDADVKGEEKESGVAKRSHSTDGASYIFNTEADNEGWGHEIKHEVKHDEGWGWKPEEIKGWGWEKPVEHKGWGWKPVEHKGWGWEKPVEHKGWGWKKSEHKGWGWKPVEHKGWGWEKPVEHKGWGWEKPVEHKGWGWKPEEIKGWGWEKPVEYKGWGWEKPVEHKGWGWEGSSYGFSSGGEDEDEHKGGWGWGHEGH